MPNCKGSYKNYLVNLVKEKKLTNNIIFKGYLKDINGLLSKSVIGLVCSKNEAFGRVTVEYMMAKLPVISANSGASIELLNGCGSLYELGNPKDLADKIEFLIKNPSERIKLGEKGYRRAIKNFRIEKTAEHIFKLYKEVISNKQKQ